ncbi:MAG TPA: tyrosine--tRNA ligase [Candidatus Paceibacterota bacterium]
MKIDTDPEKIEEVLSRGVENIYPSKDFLKKRLESGERLTIYHGIDPTGTTLHLGHSVPLRKLGQFQKSGHHIIFLIGGLTATIGDPTDKLAARKKLTPEQVEQNARLYKDQASRFISFDGENPAEMKNNYEWLANMSMEETFTLMSNATYAQTIKRDMFQKRIEEGKDIYMHEFMYPLLQGYDSVVMDVDGEVGGNDQTFNMLVGRDLLKKYKNKEKFVVSVKLLVDPTGKKMGKTEGNMVAFTDSAEDAFGKVMSWPDTLMPLAYELCTDQEMGGEGMEAKFKLAELIVGSYWGEKAAENARANWTATFSKGETPENILEIKADEQNFLSDTLIGQGIIASKNEWRRLVNDGAVSMDGEKITNLLAQAKSGTYRIGKHRFLKISTNT